MTTVSIFDVTADMIPDRAPYQPITDDDRLWLKLLTLQAAEQKQPDARAGNHRDSYGISDREHALRRCCARCGVEFARCAHAGFGICQDCVDVELGAVA
ncbi:hypothetical protein [Mycolicibacterium fortuitum]|uniref:hypothetical protein n=1 Tax=Mycolicibacterium fortuitum TaxID=1766 RepID=UPI001CE22191|nr:hypothetical protein [Mycolicibacterium fortuitum]MCA4726650.1 hypothetical protein [Mycolicibacterium fortuitum]